MRHRARALAIAVAGAVVCVASVGCKNDTPPVTDTQDTPHLPPVDYAGKGSGSGGSGGSASGSAVGSAKPMGVGLPPVSGSAGAGLPPVNPTPTAGSGSGATGPVAATGSGSGATVAATGSGGGSGSGATAPVAATGSGSGGGSGSGSAGSGDRTGGSVAISTPSSDCDVTIGLTDTTATWTGGASGDASIAHLGKLTDSVKPLDDMACRIILRADADIRYDAVIAVLEAAYAARPFKMSIITPDGGRLNASPPTSGAAGTAVRDATAIVIDKKGIHVAAQVAAPLDDADIPGKVARGLAAAQQTGTRGIMVTLKADGATHYKLFGSVLAGVKTAGFVTVLFQ